MSITRTLIATLAIAALAVPAAQAQPADMHASVAQAAAKTQQKQDLRSADARDAATKHEQAPRPHEDNVGAYTPGAVPAVSYPSGATADNSGTRPSVPGPPTWPVNPEPITPAPAAKVTDRGNGVDRTTIGLGIAGGLLAVGGLAALTSRRSRRTQRLRITA
jgi:Ni/Co efflux regulator RcnB